MTIKKKIVWTVSYQKLAKFTMVIVTGDFTIASVFVNSAPG